MKLNALLLAGAVLTGFGTATAYADCHDTSASAAGTTGSTASADATPQGQAIAKDGTHAPLESPEGQAGVQDSENGTVTNFEEDRTADTSAGDASGTADAENRDMATAGSGSTSAGSGSDMASDVPAAGGVVKNGQTMPLARQQGGGDAEIAMSGQDVTAQQQGRATAATETLGTCD